MSRTPCVLVVEDDIHISRLIAVLLEEANYNVLSANTANQALMQVDQGQPDLVILDWMLPDLPGDQVCRIIKTRTANLFLPVLMLTGRAEIVDRVAGLNAGADDYLAKPFHADELLARVHALLRIRAAELKRSQTLATLARQHEELREAYERLRSTQAQLVQSSKLASLGELVAAVAHELNNPLAIILGNAELLPELEDEADRRAVAQIIDAAQRGRKVVQSLTTFARHGKVEADWHSPRDLVERVLDLKRAAFRASKVTLEVAYDEDMPMLMGDGPQLQQALLNVLVNAEQALVGQPQARITIHVYMANGPVEQPSLLPDLTRAIGTASGKPMLVIDIADNGPGVPAHIIDRLFEPFVTTRPVGLGTGMGLAITYTIVVQHNGSLQVATAPNSGATFRITLPFNRTHSALPTNHLPSTFLPTSRRVLVVDSEPSIVDLITHLLARQRYTVIGVSRADLALEELQRQFCDIILYDVHMPDRDGITFHQQIQMLQLPRQPNMVIMTSDVYNARTEALLQQHNLPILRKPFTRPELLAAIVVGDT